MVSFTFAFLEPVTVSHTQRVVNKCFYEFKKYINMILFYKLKMIIGVPSLREIHTCERQTRDDYPLYIVYI